MELLRLLPQLPPMMLQQLLLLLHQVPLMSQLTFCLMQAFQVSANQNVLADIDAGSRCFQESLKFEKDRCQYRKGMGKPGWLWDEFEKAALSW